MCGVQILCSWCYIAFQFCKNQFNVRCDVISPRSPPLPISPFQLHIKLHKSSSPRGLQYFLRQQFRNSLHCSSLYVHKHLLHEASLPKLWISSGSILRISYYGKMKTIFISAIKIIINFHYKIEKQIIVASAWERGKRRKWKLSRDASVWRWKS